MRLKINLTILDLLHGRLILSLKELPNLTTSTTNMQMTQYSHNN